MQQAAADRIAEMVDPALNELRKLVDSAESEAVKLGAIKDVLDRAGYKATEKIDVTSKGKKLVTFNIQRAASASSDD